MAPIHILSNNWSPLTLCRRRALRATRWRFWYWVFYLVWFVMPKKQTIRKVSHRYQGCSDLGGGLEGSRDAVCVCPFCGFVIWIHKLSHFPPTPSFHLLAVYLSYWVSVLSLLCIRCDSRIYQGSLNSSVGKESTCNAGDPGSIPGLGRFAGEGIGYPVQYSWASLVIQLVKNLLAMQETWVGSLGWEDPLEEGKATVSSILAWRIPWDRKHGEVHGIAESDMTERLSQTY